MSLDELLKEPDKSSSWRVHRKKLLRVLLGVSIIAIALVGAAFFLLSIKEEPGLSDEQVLLIEQEQEAESLARLMRLREEARDLQEELNELKRVIARKEVQPPPPPKRPVKRSPPPPPDRIISFDPGEGFVEIAVETEELYIPTGSVFQARLITPIKTSIQRTFVLAETTHEYRMDLKRRIPKGSRLIGRSRLNPILKGVIVEFDTLVLPDGIETTLSGLALSRNALPEIDGLYFSDRLQTYGTALAFGFLSGFADAARRRYVTALGPFPEDTVSDKALAGLSIASFQVAEEMLRDVRTNAVEYVVVPAGEPVFVALTRRYDIDQGSSR